MDITSLLVISAVNGSVESVSRVYHEKYSVAGVRKAAFWF